MCSHNVLLRPVPRLDLGEHLVEEGGGHDKAGVALGADGNLLGGGGGVDLGPCGAWGAILCSCRSCRAN